MSEEEEQQELQLSVQMVEEIQSRLKQADERASDPGVAAQYLAAICGYLLGNINADTDKKKEFLRQLQEFAASVVDDVEAQKQMQQAQPQAGAAADADAGTNEKSGIWQPGDP